MDLQYITLEEPVIDGTLPVCAVCGAKLGDVERHDEWHGTLVQGV